MKDIHKRWSIYIDVEGFSDLYKKNEGKAYHSIGSLLSHIFRLGTEIYNSETDSLFVHQLGDGFVITSYNDEKDINSAIIVALVLMRQMLCSGYMTKAAISIGDFACVTGCYPKEIQEAFEKNQTIQLGHGVLRIFPVIGSALINSWKLLNLAPSGPFLLLDINLRPNVTLNNLKIMETASEYQIIDWINSEIEEINRISEILNDTFIKSKIFLREQYEQYLVRNDLRNNWLTNAKKLLS